MKKFLIALTTILLLSQFSVDVFAFEDCKSDKKTWTRCEGTKALDDDIYSGEWRSDKPHGQGTIIYKSGDKYEGQFKNGRKDGQGTMTYASGKIQEGIWEDGRYLGSTFYYNGKNYYECEAIFSIMSDNRQEYEEAVKEVCDQHINSSETRKAKQEIEDRKAKQEIEDRKAKQEIEDRKTEIHTGTSENTKYLFIFIILIIIIISGIFLIILEQEKRDKTSLQEIKDKSAYIKDLDIPIKSMVIFMVKWAFASIPAFIILALIGAIFFAIFGSLFF